MCMGGDDVGEQVCEWLSMMLLFKCLALLGFLGRVNRASCK